MLIADSHFYYKHPAKVGYVIVFCVLGDITSKLVEFHIHGMKPKQQQQSSTSHSNDSASRDNKLKPQLHSLWNGRDWCHHQISEGERWWFLQCPYLNSTIWLVKSDGPWTVTTNHPKLPQWWCWLKLQLQMCLSHWGKQTQLVVAIDLQSFLAHSDWGGKSEAIFILWKEQQHMCPPWTTPTLCQAMLTLLLSSAWHLQEA